LKIKIPILTFIFLAVLLASPISYSQSKKEQIEALNFSIDSLKLAIEKLNLIITDKEKKNKELETINLGITIKLKKQEDEKIEKDVLVNELQSSVKLLQDSITKLIENKIQNKVFNGAYINSENQIFSISNHIINQEFDFSVKYGLNDEWGCLLEYEGTAKIMNNRDLNNSENVTYYVGEFDAPYLTFIITKGHTLDLIISWESSPNCSKFGDSQTETYTRFNKVNK
jgi:hypothetical protein